MRPYDHEIATVIPYNYYNTVLIMISLPYTLHNHIMHVKSSRSGQLLLVTVWCTVFCVFKLTFTNALSTPSSSWTWETRKLAIHYQLVSRNSSYSGSTSSLKTCLMIWSLSGSLQTVRIHPSAFTELPGSRCTHTAWSAVRLTYVVATCWEMVVAATKTQIFIVLMHKLIFCT